MNLTNFIVELVALANNIVLPFIVGIAFLIFIINTVRYFIFGAASEDGREKARMSALYGLFAFVFVAIFWGIVTMINSSIGLSTATQTSPPCSDYEVTARGLRDCGDAAGRNPGFDSDPGSLTAPVTGDPGATVGDGGFTAPVLDIPDPTLDTPSTELPSSPTDRPAPPAPVFEDVPFSDSELENIRAAALEAADSRDYVKDVATAVIKQATASTSKYSPRIQPIIASSVRAVTLDPPDRSDLTSENLAERVMAAALLEEAQLLGDTEDSNRRNAASYLGTLNAEATAANLASLDISTLRDQSKILPAALVEEQNDLRNELLEPLTEANRGWVLFGGMNRAEAAAAAENQIKAIYDTSLSDADRIAMFDIVTSNSGLDQEKVAELRTRFFEDLSGERFFRGLGVITE